MTNLEFIIIIDKMRYNNLELFSLLYSNDISYPLKNPENKIVEFQLSDLNNNDYSVYKRNEKNNFIPSYNYDVFPEPLQDKKFLNFFLHNASKFERITGINLGITA